MKLAVTEIYEGCRDMSNYILDTDLITNPKIKYLLENPENNNSFDSKSPPDWWITLSSSNFDDFFNCYSAAVVLARPALVDRVVTIYVR